MDYIYEDIEICITNDLRIVHFFFRNNKTHFQTFVTCCGESFWLENRLYQKINTSHIWNTKNDHPHFDICNVIFSKHLL